MDTNKKYVVISRYYDDMGFEQIELLNNSHEDLLTLEEAKNLVNNSLKIFEKMEDKKRIGEEITTLKKYLVLKKIQKIQADLKLMMKKPNTLDASNGDLTYVGHVTINDGVKYGYDSVYVDDNQNYYIESMNSEGNEFNQIFLKKEIAELISEHNQNYI